MTYKISFQLYSARFFPPLSDQLPLLKTMGYDGVEPWMPALEKPAEFRKMIDDAGLACYGFHANYQDLLSNPNQFVDIAQQIGANLIIPPWLAPEDRGQSGDDWKRIGEKLSASIEQIKDSGLRVAWHNHDFEFLALPDGSLPIDHLMDAGGPELGLELDIAWVVRAGADPAEALTKFGDRILAIQPKDTAPLGTEAEGGWAAAGHGIINWPDLLPLFRKTVADHLVVEHDDPADWKAVAEQSITYLRKLDAAS